MIPCLLLLKSQLVKTVRFRKPNYVGDPLNTVRIFNEKEVDELVFLDIGVRPANQPLQLSLVAEIAQECFMPFAYGGGINSLEDIRNVLAAGAEKVVLNSALHADPDLVRKAADRFGNQSIVASIDFRRRTLRKPTAVTECGQRETSEHPVSFARKMTQLGAGEILLNSVNRDGTFSGYDLDMISQVTREVDVPVIACGGARNLDDLETAIAAGAEAAGAGSLFVYQNANRSVLINYPRRSRLEALFSGPERAS